MLADRDGHSRAGSTVADAIGVKLYERITRISGRVADAIITTLMPRMRGEAKSLQRFVSSNMALDIVGH
ncbi:hypothetical protein [Ciceribacter ferrooxidans]|uniref:Uncharacterized protein n=1 Tax=Ciceribacter ferrooxidans TaxID=2509717 RepID=A0A4Q2T5B3_9HYPH|nr:hypothetical protein [Ciceribacter ferrooxidans]RYC14005.1 hypothetical protein EUU22_10815 [Ciceribacter ferrooxidans]